MTSVKVKPNPFQYAKPIHNPVDFFGREQVIEKLVKATQDFKNIILRGEYHFGKTSLLLYLSHPDSAKLIGLSEGQIFVYLDYQKLSESKETDIWVDLIKTLEQQLL